MGLLPYAEPPPRRILGSEARVWGHDKTGLLRKSVWGLPGNGGALPTHWSWPVSVRVASEHRKEGNGDLRGLGGLGLRGGLWDGERRDNFQENVCSCSILAGHLGEAGRSPEGRVRRRLSRQRREDVGAAEGGKEAPSESLDGRPPDVETIWRTRAGGGRVGDKDKILGRGLRRASEVRSSSPPLARRQHASKSGRGLHTAGWYTRTVGLARPPAEHSAHLPCLKLPPGLDKTPTPQPLLCTRPHASSPPEHPQVHCGKVPILPRLPWRPREKSPQANESEFPGLLQCLWDARQTGSGPS